jgi:hypothetical protein
LRQGGHYPDDRAGLLQEFPSLHAVFFCNYPPQ